MLLSTDCTRRRILGLITATLVAMVVVEDASTMLTTGATITTSPPVRFTDPGTDPDLREIFLGRCADFKAGKVNPTADADELRTKNCTHLWELLYSTFKYRATCDVNQTMYEDFVAAAAITVPMHMSTFWDGWDIYSTVRSYANEGKRSWTLEFSLMGYLINSLKFCGQVEEPGFKYDSCPAADECGFSKGSMDAFWAQASVYFGKQAKGQVRVFLNSNREGGAFQNDNSYFAQHELINLQPEIVENVNIYLITNLETNTGDNCTSPSIQELRRILTQRNISYVCHDQPRDVLHLLCIDGNGSQDCVLQKDALVSPTEAAPPSTTSSSIGIHNASRISFLILIVFFTTHLS